MGKRVLNAREVVYWYNQHPLYESFQLDLSSTRDVVIIGNGNVAIDIARILLSTPQHLEVTEISRQVLTSLSKSAVRNVQLLGRRGFTHSAFALKELRELTALNIPVYCIQEEMEASFNQASHIEVTDISVPVFASRTTAWPLSV